jgi:hypothetical protein
MMTGLLQVVACLEDTKKGSATPDKIYSEMVKAGQFDPDAGMTFNQLVNDAKHRGFVSERKNDAGQRYLELFMQS